MIGSGMKFELKSKEDRIRAFKTVVLRLFEDIKKKKCLPYVHILYIDEHGSAFNRYLALYIVDGKKVYVDPFSAEFVLKLLLRMKNVTEVEYDSDSCRVIMTFIESPVKEVVKQIVNEMFRRYGEIKNVTLFYDDPTGRFAGALVDGKNLDRDLLEKLTELDQERPKAMEYFVKELKKRGVDVKEVI